MRQTRDPLGTPVATDFLYDPYGNMVRKVENGATTTAMAYADGSRMTGLTIGGVASTFTYDALGRTNARTTGAVTETHTYAGTTETVRRISDGTAGNDRLSLVDQAGARLSLSSGGTTRWTLFDNLGSLAGLVNASGSLAEAYRYDGYGQDLPGTTQAARDAGARNPFRFRGALNLGTDDARSTRWGHGSTPRPLARSRSSTPTRAVRPTRPR